jgi:hypothetical protein
MDQLAPLLFVWLIIAMISAAIGSGKGSAGGGFTLGLLLGPLGLILTACMRPTPAAQAAREAAVEVERAKLRSQAQGGAQPE